MTFRRGVLAGFALLGLVGAAALAADGSRLQTIERDMAKDRSHASALAAQAAALAREVARLQAELVARARSAQAAESQTSRLETKLASLEQEETKTAARLAEHRARLAGALAGLERLALQPAEAFLLEPTALVDTVRGVLLLRAAVPALSARAASLQQEIAELHGLRERIADHRAALQTTALRLVEDQRELKALMQRKAELRQSTEVEQRATLERVNALAAQARDIRELLAKLATPPMLPEIALIPPTPPSRSAPQPAAETAPAAREPGVPIQVAAAAPPAPPRAFPAVPASLTMPAGGPLISRFGQSDAGELFSKGITIETRPDAQVVATFDGEVKFVGQFRGYGEILIIEHDGGYHTLLAGLGRTDAVVGQRVVAGEPVGVMGPAKGGHSRLYVEIRRGGQPIDPLPWLTIRDSNIE